MLVGSSFSFICHSHLSWSHESLYAVGSSFSFICHSQIMIHVHAFKLEPRELVCCWFQILCISSSLLSVSTHAAALRIFAICGAD